MKKNSKSIKPFERALIVNNYHKTFEDLKRNKIVFNNEPTDTILIDKIINNPKSKITSLEEKGSYKLNCQEGEDFVKSYHASINAYDESIQKISTLKGIVYFTCHCLIQMTDNDFDPICELTANYLTRAKSVAESSEVFHYVKVDDEIESVEAVYKKQYHKERANLLLKHVPYNSFLIIDGPLVGSMLSSRTRRMAMDLLEKDIITVFVVKNSDSLMLANSLEPGNYNSDLDWADQNLTAGSRSSFIKYKEKPTGGHSEIFCYLKSFDNVSPLRISFMEEILTKDETLIKSLMDAIYFLVLDQGTPKDPQIRLISVAEMFAKEILKVSNPYGKLINIGLVPTINQSRWGRA